MRRVFVAIALLSLPATAYAGDADPVRDVLRGDRYRFCREKDYPLTPEEHAWCPLVGEANDACPALPAACKLPPVDRSTALDLRAGRGRPGGGDAKPGKDARGREAWAKRPPQEDTRRRPEDEHRIMLPDMSGFAKVLLVVLLVAFAVTVARALAKSFAQDREADPPPDERPPGDGAKAEPEAARGPVETDVDRLLARARASAARGDHARAIDEAYAALLRRLDGDGLIEIHPSRTNGDYVRALANRPDLRRAVRDVVRDVEHAQFGSAQPSEALFRSVLARVVPLVGRALGVALLCFGLGATLSCTTPQQQSGGFSGDTSPSGLAAIAEVLQKRGFTVRYRSEPITAVDRPTTLLLVPGASVDAAGWTKLLAWARDEGGRLVLAGVEPPPELGVKIATGGDGTEKVRSTLLAAPTYGEVVLPIPPGPRLLPTSGSEDDLIGPLLVRGDSSYAIEQRGPNGRTAVFADDRLFTNAALAVPEDAQFLARFFDQMPELRAVEIVDAWTGVGASTPFESVQRAHLTPLILQLFVLLALLYLWRGRAFSRLRDPPAEARRAFADHARALGLAYRRARASRHVVGLYAVWALERLRERVHRSGRQGLVPLAEAIAARTGRPEAEVMRVLVDAASARDEAAPPSSFRPHFTADRATKPRRDEAEGDLALMRELESFLAATGQTRRNDDA